MIENKGEALVSIQKTFALDELYAVCRLFAQGLPGPYTLIPLFHVLWGIFEEKLWSNDLQSMGISEVTIIAGAGHYEHDMFGAVIDGDPVMIMPIVSDMYPSNNEGEWFMVQGIGLSGEEVAIDELYDRILRFVVSVVGKQSLYAKLHNKARAALREGRIRSFGPDVRAFYRLGEDP